MSRPTTQEKRRRDFERILTKFDHELLPGILVRIAALIEDEGTAPGAAGNLALAIDRLRALLPTPPETPKRDDGKADVRAALRELCRVGLAGRARVIDEPEPKPWKTLDELAAELHERRTALEAERKRVETAERELSARQARVETLTRRLDEVERRPLVGGEGS